VEAAKAAVQAQYNKQDFNLQEMVERLHITLDRGTYQQVPEAN